MPEDDLDPIARSRAQWRWRGVDRPPFADTPSKGQISVWDFPRPPALVREIREVVVHWGGLEVARTREAWAVRETAHPPTYYLPLSAVHRSLLRRQAEGLFANGKALPDIGIWWMEGVVCRRLLGATRNRWLVRSSWQIASLFTLTNWLAQWAAPRCRHNLEVFMADGSHLIQRDPSRANQAVAAGSRES